MAVAGGVRWGTLSGEAQQTLSWARVHQQGPEVGTRALLVALAQHGLSPVGELFAHFAVTPQSFAAALADGGSSISVDAPDNEMRMLSELPALSPDAQRSLVLAEALSGEIGVATLDVRCLFGGLLRTTGCSALRILDNLVPVEVGAVRDDYLSWLRGDDGSYTRHLQEAFPQRGAPPADDLAARVGVVQRDGGSDSRSAGVGLLLPGGVGVLTFAGVVAGSEVVTFEVDERGYALAAGVVDGELAILSLGSAPAPAPGVALHLRAGRPGESCRIFTVDDHAPKVTILDGTVNASSGGDTLEIALTTPLPETRTAMGSPVVSADGVLIGVVGATAATASVQAFGARAIEAALARLPEPITTGTLSGAGNDAVGDVDQLGFATYVSAFADLITSPDTKPPLTIGIFGSWGMGKSFLLEHIEREIDMRQAGRDPIPRVHVVRFNAWEYSSTDVVWPGLVRKIVTRLDQLHTWPRRKRITTRVAWNLRRQWRQLGLQLVGILVAAAITFAVAIANGAMTLAGAIGAAAVLFSVGGVLKAAKDPVAQWVTALFADNSYGRQLGVMADIKHDLETLERRLHRRVDGQDVVVGRILVLIDDLDRCEPQKAVEVLQAVNLLLNFNSFIVCMGIDARIVTGAIERQYEGLLGKSGASGYEYLDKIVQIPFRIPEPGPEEVMTFVAGQLGNPPPPVTSSSPVVVDEATPDADPAPAAALDAQPVQDAGPADAPSAAPTTAVPFTYDELQAFTLLKAHLRPNPRHLKRVVNVYRLVRELARAQNERLIAQRPAATVRWLVMWSQWPYASQAMVDRYDELFDEFGESGPPDAPSGDPMCDLLKQVERNGLDPALRQSLDDDPADLRLLLAVDGCTLTWAEIRRLRRYTVNFNPAVEEQLRARVSQLEGDPAA